MHVNMPLFGSACTPSSGTQNFYGEKQRMPGRGMGHTSRCALEGPGTSLGVATPAGYRLPQHCTRLHSRSRLCKYNSIVALCHMSGYNCAAKPPSAPVSTPQGRPHASRLTCSTRGRRQKIPHGPSSSACAKVTMPQRIRVVEWRCPVLERGFGAPAALTATVAWLSTTNTAANNRAGRRRAIATCTPAHDTPAVCTHVSVRAALLRASSRLARRTWSSEHIL